MKRKQEQLDAKSKTLLIIVVALFAVILASTVYLILQKQSAKPQSTAAAASTSPTAASTPTPTAVASPLATVDAVITPKSSAAYAPITADNTTGFTSGWSTVTTDGNVTSDLQYNMDTLTILSPGSDLSAIGFYRDGIPLMNGIDYTITAGISSSISRTVKLSVLNGDDGSIYASQTYSISPNQQNLSLSFSMTWNSVFNGRIILYTGNDSSPDIQGQHTIAVSELRIIPSSEQHAVAVNQVGYQTADEKRCTFTYDAGDFFDVIDTATNSVVYTGAVVNRNHNDGTGQTNSYGDFTNVTTPGTYLVRSQIGVSSYRFVINDNTYAAVSDSLLKTLTLQRCGQTLDASWAGSMAHPQCHTENATVYGTDTKIDVSGGWHDAGDYGRYIKTGSKAVNDLLFSYLIKPNSYSDSIGSVSSGNGVSDILDEARYELEWMLKMQDSSDGGVYNKVLTSNVAELVTPDKDTQAMYVLPKETTSTADFCGTMALASITYNQSDPDFSSKCLGAAKKAYSYLSYRPNVEEEANPSGINGGEYRDETDQDARFFSGIALWYATGDSSYLNDAKALYAADPKVANGVSWSDNGAYGKYLYLMNANAQTADLSFYNAMIDSLKSEAQQILDIVNSSGYNCSLSSYAWGSNGFAANNGILLSMAYDVTGDQAYRQAALQQVDYLLGRNAVDISFVSGFGTYSPKDIHSRIAKVNSTILSGALVGGPDSSREDTATQALPWNTPDARVYSDSYDSYSTNELSIYWNAALIHLLAQTE